MNTRENDVWLQMYTIQSSLTDFLNAEKVIRL